MAACDAHGLGYRDVDGDRHTAVLVANMCSTADWEATRRLRDWERQHLRLVDGERVLDVGCGRGEAVIRLGQDVGATGMVVGVDASAAMVDVARMQSRDLPYAVLFFVGDARALGKFDHDFDVVRSERTLQWLPDPGSVVAELLRVLRPGGRLSLIDTDWSSLHIDVGDPAIASAVHDSLAVERNRPSNIGQRLGQLAEAAGCEVSMRTKETHVWTDWDPDESPAPDGCFSMASLTEDLVDTGHLEPADAVKFVDVIHQAAREQRLTISLDMHAVIALRT